MSSTIEAPARHSAPHSPETPHSPKPAGRNTDPKRNMRRFRAQRKAEVKASTAGLKVERRFSNISWWAVGWLTMAHVVVLAAPFTFTWTALAVTLFLHWVTGSLGICLGYHRLLTHDGMKTYPWVRYLFATIGTLAG